MESVKTVEKVVEARMCCGCMCCAAACPRGAVAPVLDRYGLCLRCCPMEQAAGRG